MSSIYDEVHREAMADRYADDVRDDRPDPSEYIDLPEEDTLSERMATRLSPQQFYGRYEPPRPVHDPNAPVDEPF